MKGFWLKGGGEMTWAYFEPQPNGRVLVVALLGAVRYLDRELSVYNAREEWRGLRRAGWVPGEAACPPSLRQLRAWIHD